MLARLTGFHGPIVLVPLKRPVHTPGAQPDPQPRDAAFPSLLAMHEDLAQPSGTLGLLQPALQSGHCIILALIALRFAVLLPRSRLDGVLTGCGIAR